MPFDPPASGYTELNLYPGDPPNFLVTAPSENVDPASGIISDERVRFFPDVPENEAVLDLYLPLC